MAGCEEEPSEPYIAQLNAKPLSSLGSFIKSQLALPTFSQSGNGRDYGGVGTQVATQQLVVLLLVIALTVIFLMIVVVIRLRRQRREGGKAVLVVLGVAVVGLFVQSALVAKAMFRYRQLQCGPCRRDEKRL